MVLLIKELQIGKQFWALLAIEFCTNISDRVYGKREEVMRCRVAVSIRVYENKSFIGKNKRIGFRWTLRFQEYTSLEKLPGVV